MGRQTLGRQTLDRQTLDRRTFMLRQAVGGATLAGALYGQSRPASPAAGSRQSFDFGWTFFKADAPGAQLPEFNDSAWRTLEPSQ